MTLQRTPDATYFPGTSCFDPGSYMPIAQPDGPAPRRGAPAAASRWHADGFAAGDAVGDGSTWMVLPAEGGTATLATLVDLTAASAASLTFESWLTSSRSRAEVQVTVDGGATWETIQEVEPSDGWGPVEVDLAAFLGRMIAVRLRLSTPPPADSAAPDVWRVRALAFVVR